MASASRQIRKLGDVLATLHLNPLVSFPKSATAIVSVPQWEYRIVLKTAALSSRLYPFLRALALRLDVNYLGN
jgi:Ser/Thr protein kinase RdoA (MazF antagonist)